MSSNNANSDFPKNFTPTGASNNPRYPHIESTPTSASLRKASTEQSISHRCTFTVPNQFDPNDNTKQTFPSLSFSSQTTFSHQLSSCPQTIYEYRSPRQHGAMGRRICTTQGSAFPTPPINHIRVPSANMRLSHGSNRSNIVALDNPMYAMNDYTFPNYVVQDQDEHVFNGTNRVINDTENFVPGKKRSSVGVMDVGYGLGDTNMEFNNGQHTRSLNSTRYAMPVRNTSKRYSVAQGQTQIQSSTSNLKVSDSTSTEVKRHSMYSPSVSVDGTRWHCNRCKYTTEREQDMIRHCSTLRHGGRRFFACPSCGKKFSRNDSVTRHSKKTNCGLRHEPRYQEALHERKSLAARC